MYSKRGVPVNQMARRHKMGRKRSVRINTFRLAVILLSILLPGMIVTSFSRAVITHDVIFVMNGYGTAPSTQHVDDGGKASRPADPYVMGVRFDGWYQEASCENKFDFSTPIKQKTYIYAKWTQQCKITFDMNGHGTPIDPKYAWVDETIDSPTPTDPDYVFMGWYADKYYQNLFDFSKPVGKDLTLYAQWALKITITYDAGGATKGPNWIGSVTVPFSKTISGTVAKPDASVVSPQPGYEFVGFEIDGTLYKAGQSYSYQVGYNFTVKYVWKNVTKYKITVTGGKAYSEKARTNVITEGMQGDPVFVSYDTPASGKYVTDILYEGKSLDIFDYDGGLIMPAKEVTFTIVTSDRKTATVDLRSGSGKLSEDAYVYNRPYGASITIPPVKNEIDLDGDGTKDITVTWNPGDPEAAVTKNAGTNLKGSYTVNTSEANTPYKSVTYIFSEDASVKTPTPTPKPSPTPKPILSITPAVPVTPEGTSESKETAPSSSDTEITVTEVTTDPSETSAVTDPSSETSDPIENRTTETTEPAGDRAEKASTKNDGGIPMIVWIAIILLILAAIGGGVFLFMKLKKNKA